MKIKIGYDRTIASVIFFLLCMLMPGPGSAEEVCFHCGMAKARYGHSWVIIQYEDGRRTGVCSIHCAAIDMVVNYDTLVQAITVGDYHTQKQIDAYKAYWVIGGDLPGVMTSNAKWAFHKEEDAKAFIRQHGGHPAVFEEVIRTAFGDLYEDTLAIKRKKMLEKIEKNGLNN